MIETIKIDWAYLALDVGIFSISIGFLIQKKVIKNFISVISKTKSRKSAFAAISVASNPKNWMLLAYAVCLVFGIVAIDYLEPVAIEFPRKVPPKDIFIKYVLIFIRVFNATIISSYFFLNFLKPFWFSNITYNFFGKKITTRGWKAGLVSVGIVTFIAYIAHILTSS